MPRRKSKRLLKLEERFKTIVTAHLVSLGARLGPFDEHQLDTPAGLLRVSVYADWIACRFDDVALGRQFTNSCGPACNPYSGKWNFIYGISRELNPEEALADFRRHLDRLMNWNTAEAV